MNFHIVTIFPESFDSYLAESILGRAIEAEKIKIKFYNPLDYCLPKERVDDRPYGGGPGMVMRPEPVMQAIEQAMSVAQKFSSGPRFSSRMQKGQRSARPFGKLSSHLLIINFVPSAEKLTTSFAKKVSKKYSDIILICGRYEGIDARIDKIFKTKKISVGDYVLTGGELPAMLVIDTVSRQIPGVLGRYDSLEEERVSTSEVYTRPEVLKYKGKNYRVPKVLLSGNHAKIDQWKTRNKKN